MLIMFINNIKNSYNNRFFITNQKTLEIYINSLESFSKKYSKWIIAILFSIIPFYLNINILIYIYLIIVTTIIFMFILVYQKKYIYNLCNTWFFNFYYTDFISIILAHLDQITAYVVQTSLIQNKFSCVLFFIGLAMITSYFIIVFYACDSKRDSLWNIMMKYWSIIKKWSKIDIIWGLLLLLFFLFIVNGLLFSVGMGVVVNTSTLTMYLFSLFCKLINMKLIFISICRLIIGPLRIEFFYINPTICIFFALFNCFTFFCVVDCLPLLLNFFKEIYNFFLETFLNMFTKGQETLLNIKYVYKNFIDFFKWYYSNLNLDRAGPFRKVNSISTVVEKKQMTKLIISQFFPVRYNIPSLAEYTANVKLTCETDNFIQWANCNIISILSKLDNLSYSKLTFNIVCTYDNSQFKIVYEKGSLETIRFDQVKPTSSWYNYFYTKDYTSDLVNIGIKKDLYVNEISLNKHYNGDLKLLKDNPKHLVGHNMSSLYDNSNYRNKELFRLTDPGKIGYNLQLFMEKGLDNYNYAIQQGESSTGPVSRVGAVETSYLDRELKRLLELENAYGIKDLNKSQVYACITCDIKNLEGKDHIFLYFDSDKLLTEGKSYLNELFKVGRILLLDHYIKTNKLMLAEASKIVDEFPFENIITVSNLSNRIGEFHNIFIEMHKDTLSSHKINSHEVCPFSKLFIDCELESSRYSSSQDDSDNHNLRDSIEIAQQNNSNDLSCYNNLQDSIEIAQQNNNNDLSDEDKIFLKKELKIKVQNLLDARSLSNDSDMLCNFSHLNIRSYKEVILENNNRNDFTKLLEIMCNKHRYLFSRTEHSIILAQSGVRRIYFYLAASTRKELTKDEVDLIINGLKNRREFFLDNNAVSLSNINITLFHKMITEKYADPSQYFFTDLLERLHKEKKDFFTTQFSSCRVNILITKLEQWKTEFSQ